jgi:solute:Na+ symporter, SSS family
MQFREQLRRFNKWFVVALGVCTVSLLISESSFADEAVKPDAAAGAKTNLAADIKQPTEAGQAELGLVFLDWVFIALYAVATIGLGVYYSRKQTSSDEYFVGNRNMNSFLVGVSLFATLLSSISYLSLPGEAFGKGPVLLVGLLALPLVYLVVGYGLLPYYMKHRVTSAYELLENKLGISIRMLGASMFLALRLVWMTVLVYMAAKMMTVMMGVDESWITTIVLITGAVSIIYTSLGGLQAVIITDFMQTILLFTGALLVVITVSWEFGGFSWFPTEAHHTWQDQPIFSWDPKTRITVVGTLISIFIWYTATMGGDQVSVQRFMAVKDAKAARKALAVQFVTGGIVQITLMLVGFALLAFFYANPEAVPPHLDIVEDADKMFPRFISHHLPMGVSGLVVAAMFAAAMSSIDSGVNSITAVVMTDFLGRSRWNPTTDRAKTMTARGLALGIGAFVVSCSSLMKYVSGNITDVTNKTVNLLTTPIFGLFFFAMFVPKARPVGVWCGAITGVLVAGAIAFSGPLVYALHLMFDMELSTFNVIEITQTDKATGEKWLTAEDPISFQWIAPIAFAANVAVGWIVSTYFCKQPEAVAQIESATETKSDE